MNPLFLASSCFMANAVFYGVLVFGLGSYVPPGPYALIGLFIAMNILAALLTPASSRAGEAIKALLSRAPQPLVIAFHGSQMLLWSLLIIGGSFVPVCTPLLGMSAYVLASSLRQTVARV
jgi:hypothetical protein